VTKRLAYLGVSGLVLAALSAPVPAGAAPRPAEAAVGAQPAAAACVPAQTDRRATAVRSALPVLLIGTGLNQPDDLQVTGDVVLVGQLGNGRIARFGTSTAVGGFDVLPAVVPKVEGLVLIGTTQFAADQDADRIVTVNGAQVTTFLQLRPVAGKEGVDGIGRVGNTLVVPDSPRGRVLFVGLDGRIQRTVRGFARPTGAWPLPSGAVLIADENGGTIVRLNTNGTRTTLVRGLRLPDDIVTDSTGAVFTDSLGSNNLVQVANGRATEIAGNLRQPQGLAPDRADNLLVTEFDNGRLDAVVRTFKLQPALTTAPTLAAGQSACVAFDRAPGFTLPVTIDPGAGYTVTAQPGTGSTGAIQLTGCTGLCKVQVTVHNGTRADAVWLQLRTA
jgi:hypothetical protein